MQQMSQRHEQEKAQLVQLVKQAVSKNKGKEEQLAKVQQGFGGTITNLQSENDQLRAELAGHNVRAMIWIRQRAMKHASNSLDSSLKFV